MVIDTQVRVYPEIKVVRMPTCRQCGRKLRTPQEIENRLCEYCQIDISWRQREQAELKADLDTDDDYHAWLDDLARQERETQDSLLADMRPI